MKKKFLMLILGATVALGSCTAALTACSMTDFANKVADIDQKIDGIFNKEEPCKHELIDYEGKESDCHTRGYRAYRECTVCHTLFLNGKEVTEADLFLDYDYTKHTAVKSYEGVAPTCISDGSESYEKCSDCGKIYVNGKEVTAEEIVLPADASKHALHAVAEVPSGCVTNGVKAHEECADCHKLFVNGAETSAEALAILSTGEHTFVEGALECSGCDAYKMLYDGNYYLIDDGNKQPFKTVAGEGLSAGYTAANKAPYLAYYPTARMEFGTQIPGSSITVTNEGNSWNIRSSVTTSTGTFTRFAYGEGPTAYIGRFLMVFDFSTSAEIATERVGVKVVNAEANAVGTNSKLIGTNKSEENNPDRVLTPGTVYRFMYVVEVTDETQLVQIFDCFAGVSTTSISNLHFVNLTEEGTGTAGATLLYFGEADSCVVVKEECTHVREYAVSGVDATCERAGRIAHDYCPQCGLKTVNGEPTEEVTLAVVDHNYGELVAAVSSTCVSEGHEGYYQCSWCKKYFNEQKEEIEGIPNLPLAAHATGDWLTDAESHWKVCSVCNQNIDEGAHVPGAEATDTTPQVCTVCGYVLKSALGHVHEMTHTAAKAVSCTEDGNIEYYYCSSCGKYFSDEGGEAEIVGSVTIPAMGHSMTYTAAKAVGCTEDGNVEYYYCSSCGKYFSDENGEAEITGSVVIPATGHNMAYFAPSAATCYRTGNEIEYYRCFNCGGYYSDEAGEAALSAEAIFTLPMTAHNFVDGVCTNEGCGLTMNAATIVANEASFLDTAATVNPTLLKNPGTWACQTGGGVTASIADNVLTTTVNSNSTEKKYKAFIRVLPEDPEKAGSAYVGVYLWTFDMKVTAAQGSYGSDKVRLLVGYFIQDVAGKSKVTLADVATEFTVGVTYRFAVIVENNDPGHYAQFNIRNGKNSGATVEISNASFAFYPEISKTGMERLISVTFAEPVEESAAVASYTAPEAILPSGKDE